MRRGLAGHNGPVTMSSWDDAYAGNVPPPWDIGKPQPAFLRLAGQGLLAGHVLDAGCGTGEHTLLAASSGADALGIDGSSLAIERARGKAAERGIKARFEVADALSLADLGLSFDTIIDSGLFHTFDDDSRARYVTSLASVLRPGGRLYLMCFSDRQPGDGRAAPGQPGRAARGLCRWLGDQLHRGRYLRGQPRHLRWHPGPGLAGHHRPRRPRA